MTNSGSKSEAEQESVARAANYVGSVLEKVDELPVIFTQRRSRSWVGRFTMPGNRQLTHMFVRRQLAETVGRLKSETGLSETAASGQSQGAAQLNVLVEAAGAKTSALLPVVVVLGTIGLMVSLLSIGQPSLQQEADLLGSFPRVVTLDGAAVADNATAFDKNASVFSPEDLAGVVNSLLLGAIAVWALFSVLAGSSHAASAILDDPWGYDRGAPFQPAMRRGPVPTQREAFGTRPRRIHTPIGADVIRDAAFYTILAAAYLLVLVRQLQSGEELNLLDYWRVGAASAIWLSVLVVFPLVILGAYLVIRHRRSAEGSALPPPQGWRVALGTVLAAATCFVFVGGTTFLVDARLTASADLLVTRDYFVTDDGDLVATVDGSSETLGQEYFEEDRFFTVDELARFRGIDGVQSQSISYYPADVELSGGNVEVDLLVTELETASEFLSADLDDDALSELRSSSKSPSDGLPNVWISNGLAASLDPAQGDEITFRLSDDEVVNARASTVFVTPDSDIPVIVLDANDFPNARGDLLIDEILLRATDGPLRDSDESMQMIKKEVDRITKAKGIDATTVDLRYEIATSTSAGVTYLILLPLLAVAAVVVAFGRPRTWSRGVTEFAAPARPPDRDSTPVE